MRRDFVRTTYPKTRMSIMDLPYKTHHELSLILDPGGAKDWKHLVSFIPNYTAKEVKLLETEGSKAGSSCTRQLLEDMDKKGYNVDKLKDILNLSGNKKALRCLLTGFDEESSMFEDTRAAARNRKGRIRSPPSLEESRDLHVTKRHKRYDEDTEDTQLQISGTRQTLIREDPGQYNVYPGTRETLGMDPPIDQLTEESGLYDPQDPGTRETLVKDSPNHQPTGNLGLRNPDPGTRGTIRMDHPNPQPTGKIDLYNPGPETGGTLVRDNPNHQPTGVLGPSSPDPGTTIRETLSKEHPIPLPFPVQDTNNFKQELHKRCHTENLPSENDDSQYQDADGHNTAAPLACFLTSRGQRLPKEHEDNNQEPISRGIPTLFSLVEWVLSCGSQGRAV